MTVGATLSHGALLAPATRSRLPGWAAERAPPFLGLQDSLVTAYAWRNEPAHHDAVVASCAGAADECRRRLEALPSSFLEMRPDHAKYLARHDEVLARLDMRIRARD